MSRPAVRSKILAARHQTERFRDCPRRKHEASSDASRDTGAGYIRVGANPDALRRRQVGAAAPATPPAGKRPPQAKTQAEFDAYKVAAADTDAAAMEKAADDFAAKFPDSELRILLYRTAMQAPKA